MGFTMDILVVHEGFFELVKLVMRLHHVILKVVEFMMEFHHGSFKKGKASVEASPSVLLYHVSW